MNWTWMHKPGFCPEKGYDLTYTALGQHNVLEVSPYAVFCCCCYFSHNSNFSQIASLLSLPTRSQFAHQFHIKEQWLATKTREL